MRKEIYVLLIAVLLNLAFASCSQNGPIVEEEEDAAFQRGRSYLKVGKEEEALGEFLSVTRRTMNSPKSHLEVGRLFLKLKSYQKTLVPKIIVWKILSNVSFLY